jgi:hypothetical protein
MKIYEITQLPRVFYRGINPGDTRRIRTSDEFWNSHLFVSSDPEGARMYGSELSTWEALPEAKILYEGTAAFRSVAKAIRAPHLLGWCSEVLRRATEAGYDAVWFKRQSDVGTAIINPKAFRKAVTEDLNAGSSEGSGAVGTASVDSMVMKPPQRIRRGKQIPQVGYGIKIGNTVIPTPGYNSDNDLGQNNKVVGG